MILSSTLRQNFLNFFKKKGHKIVPSSSLIPDDPSVLLTTAGMQQFKPYYLEEISPYGSNVASCQKCFRTSDIEEVGDESHLTFLEMLGNFSFTQAIARSEDEDLSSSFGGYFKEEAINYAYELLNSQFQIPKSKIIITIFAGDKEIPLDKESERIWEKIGFSKNKGNLQYKGREDNFWGPTGLEGPCGPTTEIYFQDLEIWNLVFNEYYQDKQGRLTLLKKKGVDTGMGLERLAMVMQNKPDVYKTDLFEPIIKELRLKIKNSGDRKLIEKTERIIADHVKGAVFLISEGVLPSNIERGYIVRRILRRAIRYGKLLNLPKNFLIPLAQKTIEIYQDTYPELKSKETDTLTVIQKEGEKFERTLEKGLKEFQLEVKNCKLKEGKLLSGKTAFNLYQSYGFPLELTKELATEEGLRVDEVDYKKEFKKHQEISRAGAEKKFGGLGAGVDYSATKLHTATHLLHQALRDVLGENVKQMGSDITSQRLRFDFSHSQKLSKEEIKKVEDLVNQKIKEDLEIKKEEMSYKQALKSRALAFFREKYPERVNVYSIKNFSKEICAGPHAKRTSELGQFKIVKEENLGAGLRRIRAILK